MGLLGGWAVDGRCVAEAVGEGGVGDGGRFARIRAQDTRGVHA